MGASLVPAAGTGVSKRRVIADITVISATSSTKNTNTTLMPMSISCNPASIIPVCSLSTIWCGGIVHDFDPSVHDRSDEYLYRYSHGGTAGSRS